MDSVVRAAALGLVGSVLAILVRRYSKEQGLLLSLGIAAGLLALLLKLLSPVLDLAGQLAELAGVQAALIAPVYKCVAIGLVTQLAADLCQDAGESAAAQGIRLVGGAAALYVCAPLVLAVMELVQQLLGG